MIFRCLCGKSGLTPLGPAAKLTHYKRKVAVRDVVLDPGLVHPYGGVHRHAGQTGPMFPGPVVRVPLPVILPVKFFLESPGGFFAGHGFARLRRALPLLPQAITEALRVQFANPVLNRQLLLLLWARAQTNQRVRLEARAFGHGDGVPVQPAEFLRLRPTVPLGLLAHREEEPSP